MNAESEMQRGDGLGGERRPITRQDQMGEAGGGAEPEGTIYALAVVVEADTAREAFDRVADAAGPEPCNAHFVGEPTQISRADEYDTATVGHAMVAGLSLDGRRLVAALAGNLEVDQVMAAPETWDEVRRVFSEDLVPEPDAEDGLIWIGGKR
jgi:hypothetical protein